MAAGALMVFGLSRGLEQLWAASLEASGYGTPAQIREAEQALAGFAPVLASWQARDAVRRETAKARRAETPGVDFHETFDVPVYRAPSRSDLTVRTDWDG